MNVGSTSEGLIPQPSIERLKEVGQWIKKMVKLFMGRLQAHSLICRGVVVSKKATSFTCMFLIGQKMGNYLSPY